MQYEKAVMFLERVGVRPRGVSGGGWLRASCPLGRIKHAKLRDDHPSFAMNLSDDESWGKCQACGFKGPLRRIVQELERYDRRDRPDLHALLVGETPAQRTEEQAQQFHEKRTWASSFVPQAPRELPEPVVVYQPEGFLRNFTPLPPHIREYLRGRNLTDQMMEDAELLWHGQDSRIVIPMRDETNKLVGVSRRLYTPEGEEAPKWKPKFRHSTGMDMKYFLYGEHDLWDADTLYMVEGHFDRVVFRAMGLMTVAICGGAITPYQLRKVKKIGKRVIFVKDGDKPGRDGIRQGDRIAAEVTAKVRQDAGLPAMIYETPEGYDPDDLPGLLGERFYDELTWK